MFLVAYSGSSMYPTLREPALLEVMPYGDRPPSVGDVAFYHEPMAEQPFVHRIVRVTPAGISTRGDNNAHADAFLLQPGNIKGRVVAAWRGHKRQRIAGGLVGRLSEPVIRSRRRIRRCAVALLDPIYQTLSNWGLIARALPLAFRPRIVAFRNQDQDQFQLLLKSRVVGRYDDQLCQWLIRRPFNLLVENKSLPTPPATERSTTSHLAEDNLP